MKKFCLPNILFILITILCFPVNDTYCQTISPTCSGANQITFNKVTPYFTVNGSPGSPSISVCTSKAIVKEGWFYLTATSNYSWVAFNKTTSAQTGLIYIYSGTCGALSYLTCDSTSQSGSCLLNFSTTSGANYYIRVINLSSTDNLGGYIIAGKDHALKCSPDNNGANSFTTGNLWGKYTQIITGFNQFPTYIDDWKVWFGFNSKENSNMRVGFPDNGGSYWFCPAMSYAKFNTSEVPSISSVNISGINLVEFCAGVSSGSHGLLLQSTFAICDMRDDNNDPVTDNGTNIYNYTTGIYDPHSANQYYQGVALSSQASASLFSSNFTASNYTNLNTEYIFPLNNNAISVFKNVYSRGWWALSQMATGFWESNGDYINFYGYDGGMYAPYILITYTTNCIAPSFTGGQPASQSICSGSSIPVSFTVNTTGDSPVSYQWQVNNGSWTNITDGGTNPEYSGSTSTVLLVANCQITAYYRCIATNCSGAGVTTSNTAILTVNSPPTSNVKFINQVKNPGDNVTYSVSPGGTSPFAFQWIKGVNDIPGQTNSIFNINPIECADSSVYYCKINNICSEITAKIANLFVLNCSRFKYAISGEVRYDNKDSTAMTNTVVHLYNEGDTLIEDNTTDFNGSYIFVDLVNDSYKLKSSTTKDWGGSNPVDALIVNRNFIGLYPITDPMKKRAADVNIDGKINPTDALMINRRYIGVLPRFIDKNKDIVPDWLFSEPTITLAGTDTTQNIVAICAGDVNADYKNIPAKRIYQPINSNSKSYIVNRTSFDLPVYLNDNAELGAMGIKLGIRNLPAGRQGDELKIINVKSDIPGLIYNITDDGVNIAWSADNDGYKFTPNKPLLVISCQLQVSISHLPSSNFQLSSESVLADINANYISTDKLSIPKLEFSILNSQFSIQIYPNPFNSITNIDYTLPEDANVDINIYNVLGEKIASLVVNVGQQAGEHTIQYNAASLREGVYYCVLRLTTQDLRLSKTNILMIAK